MTRTEDGDAPKIPVVPRRPTLRQRYDRHPPGLRFWLGAGLLGLYAAAAVSAVFYFGSSLGTLPYNYDWGVGNVVVGPSWSHPFGVVSGLGTGLFEAIWRATPWDLAIVSGILGIDVCLGWFLGAIAGLREGRAIDRFLTFVGDSVGAIPPFILVTVAYAGTLVLAFPTPDSFWPTSWQYLGLPIFVVLFGLILWPTMARSVRERARLVARSPYVEASRASGASSRRILFRHVLPNSVGAVLAQVPVDVAPIFFVLSAIPWYWGCEAPSTVLYATNPGQSLPAISPLPWPSFPEWGNLLGVGTCEGLTPVGAVLPTYWWMYLFPLLTIVIFGLAVGLFCDGIDHWRRLKE